MWADARQATAWGLVWIGLLTAAFLAVRLPTDDTGRPTRLGTLGLPILLLIAAAVRLLPALWLPVGAGYDIDSYRLVTDALLDGREIYTSVSGRHPYLPFQMVVLGAMAVLSRGTGLPYVVAVKLPTVAADVALVAALWYGTQRLGRSREAAALVALLYALNPVSVLVTAFHGQFEAITLLLIVLAWLAWPAAGRRHASALGMGLAVANKTWPVILLPVIVMRLRGWRPRLVYTALALAVPVLFTAIYLIAFSADPAPMLRRALTHRGVPGYWGIGAPLWPLGMRYGWAQAAYDWLVAIRTPLLLAAVLLALWWTRRQAAHQAILTVILSLLAATVGFGIQWLLWPVPFALLSGEWRWTRAYTLAAVVMLLVHLYGLHMVPWFGPWEPGNPVDLAMRFSALPAWLIVVAWTIDRLRRASVEQRAASEPIENPAT